jgi:NAD(P)-dependent dehydrogenase (short-subunit alcohol dehydrogenase family)
VEVGLASEARLPFAAGYALIKGGKAMCPIEEQVLLVTGSTDGIGKITARKLALLGASVLVHGRSREKCTSTVKEIRESTGSQKLDYYVGDLSSLSAVRALARDIMSDHSQLHALINNAGVGPGTTSEKNRPLSKDGHELLFAVNYLAPFLLTHLLMPVLGNSAPSRIVNVSSAAQERIDFGDVMLARDYDSMRAYAQSKLALTMFTLDIAGRLKGQDITANCLHPGSLLDTKMVRESGASPWGSAESGAEVEIYVTTGSHLEGRTGIYFKEKHESRAHEQAYEIEARKKLRRLSEKLTGVG